MVARWILVGLALALATPARAGVLADYDALVNARAAAERGETKEALELLAGIERRASCREDRIFEEATLLAAELLAPDDPQASAIRLLLLPPDGPRLALAIRRLRAAKQEAAAKKAEVVLLTEAVASAESKALATELGPDGLATRLDRAQQMDRVRALLDEHVNEDANREARTLAKALGPKHELACELGYVIGKSERKLRRYKGAIVALGDARTRCAAAKQHDFARRAALLETQVRGIRGQIFGTTKVAKWLEAKHAGHSYVDDAWLIVAEVLARRDKPAEAKAVYERIRKMKGADQATLAAWRLAFEAILADDTKTATELLSSIVEQNPPREVERARALYWLARLDPERRESLAHQLADRPSFYTWLMLDRLRREDPKLAKAIVAKLDAVKAEAGAPPKGSDALKNSEPYRRAFALHEKEEHELATAELAHLECKELTELDAYTLANAYHEIGAYPEAQRILRSRPALFSKLTADNLHLWRTAYSRAFDAEIEEAAKKAKVEPWFLMGLVREESTFDPNIVSWAGAVGLGQLMPPTAIGAYAEVYGGRLDLAKLTEPLLNLRLGAHVLKQGLRGFGAEPLALAAYNGGPGLARRTLPAAPVAFDRWVETITVRETRRYVKRVTETWGLYRWLYADSYVDLPDQIGPKGAM